jgi:hypothetical protein
MLFWNGDGDFFYWCGPFDCYLPLDCIDDYPPDDDDGPDDGF